MIKLENTEVYGWEAAIRGMRNPMNSWDKSDSAFMGDVGGQFYIGEDDLRLMNRLAKAGSDHRKFLRMITVTVDITAPLYWWKEFDTYKVGTIANSCSTMHRIHAKEFILDDFSHEHLFNRYNDFNSLDALKYTIRSMNHCRAKYLETKDKSWWWQLIQLLPSSYNQRRTCCLNYEVLANICFARQNHKLDEWHTFCDWILTLPYFEDIINAIDKT